MTERSPRRERHDLFAEDGMKNVVRLFQRIHSDQRGAVSLETILILGAIAIPALIFLIKFGWPMIKSYFTKGVEELQQGADAAKQ